MIVTPLENCSDKEEKGKGKAVRKKKICIALRLPVKMEIRYLPTYLRVEYIL
jgi:hypothetical protein